MTTGGNMALEPAVEQSVKNMPCFCVSIEIIVTTIIRRSGKRCADVKELFY